MANNCLSPRARLQVPAAALRRVLGAEAGLVLLGAAARDFPGGGAGRWNRTIVRILI